MDIWSEHRELQHANTSSNPHMHYARGSEEED